VTILAHVTRPNSPKAAARPAFVTENATFQTYSRRSLAPPPRSVAATTGSAAETPARGPDPPDSLSEGVRHARRKTRIALPLQTGHALASFHRRGRRARPELPHPRRKLGVLTPGRPLGLLLLFQEPHEALLILDRGLRLPEPRYRVGPPAAEAHFCAQELEPINISGCDRDRRALDRFDEVVADRPGNRRAHGARTGPENVRCETPIPANRSSDKRR